MAKVHGIEFTTLWVLLLIMPASAIAAPVQGSGLTATVSAPASTCVGGLWKNLANQQLVHAGPGLREPPVPITYGTFQSLTTQTSVVMPSCPYFLGQLRLPIFMIDWSDFHPESDPSNPNNPGSGGLPGYVPATPAELDSYANGPTGAAQYFRDVSGGQADIRFDIFGWINSARPGSYLKARADYITLNPINSQYQCDRKSMFLDTLRNAVAYHAADLNLYDTDGNGVMDGSILLYEGQGGLCNGGNLSWLSGSVGVGNPATFRYQDARTLVPGSDPNSSLFANQNVYVEEYNNLPERVSGTAFYFVATWVHELGHLLLGYSDYYETKFNIGNWALSGNHADIPTHPAAFEKWLFAHWIEPQTIQSSGQYAIAANEIPDGASYADNTYLYRIVIDQDPRKFITIENRWFDSAGNTATQWARAYGRESGLQIVEFNLGVDTFSTNPLQLYRQVPARTGTLPANRSFRSGDSFAKCYQTMCVTIDQISAPGQQVQFSVTITPP